MALTDEEKQNIAEEEEFRAKARQEAESKLGKKKSSGGNGCSGCLVIVLIGFAWVVISAGDRFMNLQPPDPAQKARDQLEAIREQVKQDERYCNSGDTMALVQAQSFIKSVLKAPTTASFPWYGDGSTVKKVEHCTYDVVTYVDAENSFGAKLRNRFHVVVGYSKATHQWYSLKLEELR
jgi:hypothetical protein